MRAGALGVLALCFACAAQGALAREPATAVARNAYMKNGIVVSTNEPAGEGEGVLPASYTPVAELKSAGSDECDEEQPCESSATGYTAPETPIEDRIDASAGVAAKHRAYEAAKEQLDAVPCRAQCLIKRAHLRRLELSRARSEAHERISAMEDPDVEAANDIAEG